MPRRVFFSFDFTRDSRRVAQVRNSPLIGSYDKPPFLDAAAWEKIKNQGDVNIKKWIDDNLIGTSVTIVLIGADTSNRKWVNYEIQESVKKGNGFLGITLHNINDPLTGKDLIGKNPFSNHKSLNGTYLDHFVKVYDWINNSGRENIGLWIEQAAKDAGR